MAHSTSHMNENTNASPALLMSAPETVLIIGSTGNIGTSAVLGALRSNRKVPAVVRNQESARKPIENVDEISH